LSTRNRSAAALTAGLLALAVPSAAAQPAPAPARIIDAQATPDCEEFVPESYSLNGVTDDGKKVSLDVYVLLDLAASQKVAKLQERARSAGSVKLARRAKRAMRGLVSEAEKMIGKAPTSYEPLNIDLNYKRWGLLAPLDEDGSARKRTDDSQSIIDLAKEQFGGKRPAGFDIVYVLTDLDMTAPGIGSAVAGQADCIGGVRYDQHAFAVGEISSFEDLEAGPLTFYHAATSKIAAHEIGHLMGAHHHYQDCVEGIPTELDEGEISPCTLMTNAVDFQSLNFSALEGAVVRGHALDFAR
jgi:hypothetical protein